MENAGNLSDRMIDKLNKSSAICQIVAYFSLIGAGLMWYNISNYVGIFFIISTIISVIFIRLAMKQPEEKTDEIENDDQSLNGTTSQ